MKYYLSFILLQLINDIDDWLDCNFKKSNYIDAEKIGAKFFYFEVNKFFEFSTFKKFFFLNRQYFYGKL